MEQGKPETADHAGALLEAASQLSLSSLQLLVMLDVVYDWDRGDAIEVGVSAAQTESMARSVASAQLRPGLTELERLLRTLEGVILRAERLARLAPAQSRDDASGGAMASALRRLADASAELRDGLVAQPCAPAQDEPGTTP
ncbi:MAG: hypothetical protein DI563_16465 [Variovorax paradoxus]|uniref:Uncharacterized protein n=1 Tax=Variovorax paradoxus TaxID=34073 RepID=A0A2W5SBP0_VARPD|nr:MAG: hypothetical protein DI563_16465 [Variovorax paradoxus]